MRPIIKSLVAGGAVIGVGLPLTLALTPDQGPARTSPDTDGGEPVPLSLADDVPAAAGSLLPDGVTTSTGTLPDRSATTGTDSGTDGPDGGTTGAVAPELVDGHLLREIGQVAGLADDAGEPLFELVVTSIETTDTCPSRVDEQFEPVNGQFLLVELTAAMAGSAGDEMADPEDVFVPVAADFFHVVGPDGVEQPGTLTDASWSCYTTDELISPSIVPGQSDSGYVVLDVAADTGTLVYDPSGTGSGWAWEF